MTDKDGYVDTTQFSVGTKLFIETVKNVYEITFLNPDSGLVLARNGTGWLEEVEVRFNGSALGASMLKVACINRGLSMEFQYIEGPKKGKVHITTAVVSGKVVGPDDAWNYELWEDEE